MDELLAEIAAHLDVTGTDEAMLSMALHLRDRDVSLRDIAVY
ncbi:hypothetical protein [Streptosporangium sp. NPDC000396]